MIVKVLRNGEFHIYEYNQKGRRTVAEILDYLNYNDDLVNTDGQSEERITWECSCMQKLCGACAMIINGKPALACATFIDADKDSILELKPLSKFPLIKDLKVDRSIIDKSLRKAGIYPEEIQDPDAKTAKNRYAIARCIKCGICLEVCPNYIAGSNVVDDSFFAGAVFANDAYLQYTTSADRKDDIAEEYKKHFEGACSKALSCRDVCPLHLPTLSSIGYMNKTKKTKKNKEAN